MPSSSISQGHRKRLREKFLKSGLKGFHDYEIIELLLSLGIPRKDCKQQAKEVIKKFKTLRGALSASLEELQEIDGIGPHSAFGVKLIQEVAREFLKEQIVDKPIYKSAQEVFDYLYHSMRDLKKEVFKVIYLNSQNQIIDTADLFEGTVNSSSISPREVMESAIKHNETAEKDLFKRYRVLPAVPDFLKEPSYSFSLLYQVIFTPFSRQFYRYFARFSPSKRRLVILGNNCPAFPIIVLPSA